MSEQQQDPYNPEGAPTDQDDLGNGPGETVKEEGGFVSPAEVKSAEEGETKHS